MTLIADLIDKLKTLSSLSCESILETSRFNHTHAPNTTALYKLILQGKPLNEQWYSLAIALANGFMSYEDLTSYLQESCNNPISHIKYLIDNRKITFAHTGSVVLDFALIYDYPEIEVETSPENKFYLDSLNLKSKPADFKIKISMIREIANLFFTRPRRYMEVFKEKPLAFDLPFKPDGSLDQARELMHYASKANYLTKVIPEDDTPYYIFEGKAFSEFDLRNKIESSPEFALELRYIVLDAFFKQETTAVNQI